MWAEPFLILQHSPKLKMSGAVWVLIGRVCGYYAAIAMVLPWNEELGEIGSPKLNLFR
jgi:hypothetical protein